MITSTAAPAAAEVLRRVTAAERAGQPIRFKTFLLMAFPLMLLSIAISTVYLYLRYL